MTISLLDAALAAEAAGLSVLPPTETGEKRPDVSNWAGYRTPDPKTGRLRRETPETLASIYGNGRTGLGLVMGAASKGLEAIDFDNREIYATFLQLAKVAAVEAVERIRTGFEEETPNGAHLLYYCPELRGNTKLAQRPEPTAENPNAVKTLIETRGEGGYLVVAPSHGRVHPSGLPYVLVGGGFDQIVTISDTEREEIWALARSLDETPPKVFEPHDASGPAPRNAGRPGDLFADRTSWPEVLEPCGWRRVFERSAITYWRRPGKDRGISATTNATRNDTLIVFSTSTPFDPSPSSYSKFGAYAVLNHDGDWRAAATALAVAARSQAAPSRNGQQRQPVALDAEVQRESDAQASLPAIPFPLERLPMGVLDFALEVSDTYGVSPEMVILPILACLGAAIGNSRRIVLKPGQTESAAIWAVLIAPPGSVKSPVLRAVTAPLWEYERQLQERNKDKKQQHARELQGWENTGKTTRGLKPEEPVSERLAVQDSTIEELSRILAENPRGLLIAHDEITAWVRGMNQYKQRGDDRAKWLSFWSGEVTTIDRRSAHGDPVRIWQPFLALTGGIQPGLLHELRLQEGGDDGFMDRFLFAWPKERLSLWSESTVSSWVSARYTRILGSLLGLQMEPDAKWALRPQAVTLTPEAHQIWVDGVNRLRHERYCADFDSRLGGVLAKLEVYAARLALIFHLTRVADEETDYLAVEADSMANAWEVTEYFKATALRVRGQFELTDIDVMVQELVEWARAKDPPIVHVRDAMRSHRRGCNSKSSTEALFNAAQDRGYGRVIEATNQSGGRPTILLDLTRQEQDEGP